MSSASTFEEEGQEHGGDRVCDDDDVQKQQLFSCPLEGCVCTYQRYTSLERHLDCGKCKMIEEKETLYDKAKNLYAEKLVSGFSAQPHITGSESTPEPSSEDLPRGWALKESKKGRRFSEKQKMYLDEMFDKGKRSGHKIDPTIVAKEMHFARDFDGNRKFQMSEFLTASQIQGYFSRKASKDRRGANDTSQEENHRAAEEEEAYMLTRQIVLDECQLRHPIVYDSIDLCQLYSEGKLNKLSIALLQEICNNLEIDTSDVKVRRKAPYIESIGHAVKLCSCISGAGDKLE